MTELRELGTLVVVVGKARNLPNKSRFGKQDPFCTVHVGDEKQRTKAIKRGGQHPEWDEELRFTINEDTDDLLIRSESQQFDSISSVAKHTSLSSHTNPSHPTPPPKDGTPTASLNSSLSGSVTAQALASKSRKGPIGKKGGKSMKVSCFADDAKEPDLIGEVTVPIDEVLKLGEVDEWYEFSFKDKYSGEVYLELTFYSNDAPPVKRNVPRPSVHPYDLMPSSSSPSLSGRQGGLAASGSVSGMNLYIPPYVEAVRISPGPPPGSGGFADLGLPSGHRHSLAGSNNSMDALTRPMSGLSINTPPAQQTPPRIPPPQAYGGHGHRHSVGGPADAPWSHDMPQQQPQVPALLRPVSAAQSSTGYIDPRRGTPQPYHDSRTTTPVPGIPNSLLPGQEPRPHAQSFSGQSRPIVPPQQPSYLQPSPGPTPPPHPSSAPPVQLQPHYQVPVSSYARPGQVYDPRSNTPYQDVRQGLPQPPPSRSNSLPVRAPSPQPPPPQQGYYPDRSYTPRPSYPNGQSPLPPQQTPPGYPPQQDYNRQSYPGPSQVEDHHQNQHGYGQQPPPPPEPAREPTPNNQGYIPWYQQTQPSQPPPQQYDPPPPPPQLQPHYDPYQQHQQSYTPAPAPPPVPPHRPSSAQPIAPPRPAVGYYPSDELYAQEPTRSTYQSPQPPPRGSTPQPAPWQQQAPQPPPRGSTPQPPSWQQQQQRPVSPQPPIPGQWQQQQQQQPDSYSYQNQSAPPPPQQYDQRYASPPPPQNYPSSSYPQQPTSSYPQQSPYPPQQSYQPQAGYRPLAPSPPPAPPGWQSTIPQAQPPPRGVSPAPAPARAPSPLPTQMGQDWRSYLQSLPTPGRTPSPVPPPQHHQQQQQQYVPPPSLPSSLKPPEGWQSSVPTSNDGHQWKR